MNRARRAWIRLRGHGCYSCQFVEVFRSNGDGQVSRLHSYCRNPASPYFDRPIPPDQWCDLWQRAQDGRKGQPEELDRTGLTT